MTCQNTQFEFPLNERIRAFLRLEAMLEEFDHFIGMRSHWDVQSGIYALNRLLHFLERKDYRLEITQELERQLFSLNRLINNPGVDTTSLNLAIVNTETYIAQFRNMQKCYDDSIRKDELLNSIRLRITTANLTSSVDLPCLHSWLHSKNNEQQDRLNIWASHFSHLKSTVMFILSAIRKTSIFEQKFADMGIYQQSLGSTHNYSLIRLIIDSPRHIFPEISGGKHRINVRFLEMTSNFERPKQIEDPLDFQICFCS